jgi:hypothetical protein
MVRRLLKADRATLAMLRHSPFDERPPSYIRASFYAYEPATPAEGGRLERVSLAWHAWSAHDLSAD